MDCAVLQPLVWTLSEVRNSKRFIFLLLYFRFAPIWKNLAENIKDWSPIVNIASINCADQSCDRYQVLKLILGSSEYLSYLSRLMERPQQEYFTQTHQQTPWILRIMDLMFQSRMIWSTTSKLFCIILVCQRTPKSNLILTCK